MEILLLIQIFIYKMNHIGVLASNGVDCGFI